MLLCHLLTVSTYIINYTYILSLLCIRVEAGSGYLGHVCLGLVSFIKTSGSESRPRKVELASAHKKRDNYREYFTHNNEACKNPYKTTLPH